MQTCEGDTIAIENVLVRNKCMWRDKTTIYLIICTPQSKIRNNKFFLVFINMDFLKISSSFLIKKYKFLSLIDTS